MAVVPLSPSQVSTRHNIPDAVLEAVNNLLLAGKFSFTQEELIARVDKRTLNLPKGIAFYMQWLDFEDLYRVEGWKVTYHKPARDENWDAYFEFKR